MVQMEMVTTVTMGLMAALSLLRAFGILDNLQGIVSIFQHMEISRMYCLLSEQSNGMKVQTVSYRI